MIYTDIGYIILELLSGIGLYVLAAYAEKALNTKWRLCYVLPMIFSVFAIALYGFEWSLLGAYAASVLILTGFVKEDVKLRKRSTMAAEFLVILSVAVCLFNPGYRGTDYVEQFQKTFAEMRLHYNLSEHKKIDWDGLYQKYLPLFEEVDQKQDQRKNALTWQAFSVEFHDGHVDYTESVEQEAGNDYGLALMTLDNGKTVAVNVDKDSAAFMAGIKNGTVITEWDHVEINEAIHAYNEKPAAWAHTFAVKENEDFYRALLVAGTGGECVEVSYLDDTGKKQTAMLSKIGKYWERFKNTVEIIDQGVEISNLEWKNLDEKTALMRMRFMAYDTQQNFDQMSEEVRKKLLELKGAGVNHLILDMRSNGGGSDEYVKALIKLIAPEGKHVYAYDGVFDRETMTYLKDETTGRYLVGNQESYRGEDLWSHGDIVILVNTNTISAGDHFTMLASAFPNVTIMGFTHSSCSAQGISGVAMGDNMLTYSSVLLLNEDGTVFIDTDETRTATVPLDIKIPFDEKAVAGLFDEKEDYVLQYAKDFIRRKEK